MNVQVYFYNIIFYLVLFLLQLGWNIRHILLQQGFLDIVGRNIYLFYFFIIAHNIVYQSRFGKEITLLERMQLVEFYGINTHFRIDGILQKESTVVFISKQLHGYMFHTVQCTLFELLQMHLHIRLDGSSAAQCPAFTFCRQIQIIDKIVAVVHQISIKSSR